MIQGVLGNTGCVREYRACSVIQGVFSDTGCV